MRRQPFKPAKLVIEFRAGSGISIRQVKAADMDTIYFCFNIAAMLIFRVTRQYASYFFRFRFFREDSYAVPAFLSMPDRMITRVCNRLFRKFFLRRF